MSSSAILLDEPRSSITRLTGRQKLALMLRRAGYSHAEIAEKLGIRHRQAASRLISRAKLAERDLREAAQRFLED